MGFFGKGYFCREGFTRTCADVKAKGKFCLSINLLGSVMLHRPTKNQSHLRSNLTIKHLTFGLDFPETFIDKGCCGMPWLIRGWYITT